LSHLSAGHRRTFDTRIGFITVRPQPGVLPTLLQMARARFLGEIHLALKAIVEVQPDTGYLSRTFNAAIFSSRFHPATMQERIQLDIRNRNRELNRRIVGSFTCDRRQRAVTVWQVVMRSRETV